MQTVTVVGAGFSGLVTAYYLLKKGFKVRVLESSSRVGGLLRTIRTEHGPVETAANGILNSARLEAICTDVGVPLQSTRREGRARFIYRGRPRQWPLTVSDSLALGARLVANATRWQPRPFETIASWGERVIGRAASEYLLEPALSGIFAGDPKRLSASLILHRRSLPVNLQVERGAKAKHRGTVAPVEGMQQLVDGLFNYLERSSVDFFLDQVGRTETDEPVVVCTSANAAASYFAEIAPELSNALKNIEMLPLVTATCFYPASAARLKGFGCLFPPRQGFRARGVLFNSSIFDGRGPAHSETWIFGGALDPDVFNLNEEELVKVIDAERARLYGRIDVPLSVHPTYWPKALPHYSIELERVLKNLPQLPRNVALVGNYLGGIGLSKIIDRAAAVAAQFGKTRSNSPTTRGGL